MSDEPIYTSNSNIKNFWKEYRIYADRLEFDTLWGLMTIPFEHVETIDVLDSDVKALFRGDLRLKNFRPAIKIDWANFLEHVVIDKSEGLVRRVLFTPDDPKAFKNALEEAVSQFHETHRKADD